MKWAGLAWASLWSRRATALLTIASIAISVALLLGVQKLRTSAREGFANTISGVDLIVGARSGPVNLLLYSVFRTGEATSNVSWASYQRIASHPDVAWTIPLSLGDSHRGFRVLGTTPAYFEHYRYTRTRSLAFAEGRPFASAHEVVLGAHVARSLGYGLGSTITVAHGLGHTSFTEHPRDPLEVVGILEPTGTPVDLALHVPLEAISAMHGQEAPESITAFLVSMRDRAMTLTMQRAINDYRAEPLLAIIPGVVLGQLWGYVGVADAALFAVGALVALAGLLGMLAAILTSLGERRREMAVIRSVGAQPRHVFGLLVAEAGWIATLGALAGVVLCHLLLWAARPLLMSRLGIAMEIGTPTRYDLLIVTLVIASALLVGLLPAWRAYRNTLGDGLTIRA